MKKINLGLVLTLLTLICLTMFVISEEKSKAEDIANVEEICKEYFNVYNKYSMLEKDDRNMDKEMNTDRYNTYLSEMKQDLSKYISDEKLDEVYEQYKKRLDQQFYRKYVMKEYNKEFIEIKDYNFNDSYITVVLDVNITMDRDARIVSIFNEETNRHEGTITNVSATQKLMEIIVFEKIGNEYRIILHSMADLVLDYNQPNRSFGGMGF